MEPDLKLDLLIRRQGDAPGQTGGGKCRTCETDRTNGEGNVPGVFQRNRLRGRAFHRASAKIQGSGRSCERWSCFFSGTGERDADGSLQVGTGNYERARSV